MGDVADILGAQKGQVQTEEDKLISTMTSATKASKPGKGPKKKGIPRELMNLIGPDGIAPQPTVKPVSKAYVAVREDVAKTHWVYTTFNNEARNDGVAIWYHWQRATESKESTYAYAKFTSTIPTISYSDDEYATYLHDDKWEKGETDELCRLCGHYELRWPVVLDRFLGAFPDTKNSALEDLQSRYYTVKERLEHSRGESSDRVDGGHNQRWSFNTTYERKRRKQLDMLFKRSRADEEEEAKLKDELRGVEAALKKLGKHPAPKKTQVRATQEVREATVTEDGPQGPRVMPLVHEKLVPDPRPEPGMGRPFLASARLTIPVLAPKLGKGMVNKMKQLHADLNLPARPLPTQPVCDSLDALRREVVELFSIMKSVHIKEKQLQALKNGEDPTSVLGRGFSGDASQYFKGPTKGQGAGGKRKARPMQGLGASMAGSWAQGGGGGEGLGGSNSSLASMGGDAKKFKRTSM